MTFSIVARCEQSGMFGVAISSSSPAVAARCAFGRAQVGAVASQNITDPALGTKVLNAMEHGMGAADAIEAVKVDYRFLEYRQLLAVDDKGDTAIHSGKHALGTVGEAQTRNAVSAGNLLDNPDVPKQMLHSFARSQVVGNAHLGLRLLQALEAGLEAGGEASPVHSAGLLVVDHVSWPIVDLRVDWSDACPIKELFKLWDVYEPQIDDYVTRAQNPEQAPSYGVAGDP